MRTDNGVGNLIDDNVLQPFSENLLHGYLGTGLSHENVARKSIICPKYIRANRYPQVTSVVRLTSLRYAQGATPFVARRPHRYRSNLFPSDPAFDKGWDGAGGGGGGGERW